MIFGADCKLGRRISPGEATLAKIDLPAWCSEASGLNRCSIVEHARLNRDVAADQGDALSWRDGQLAALNGDRSWI